MQVKKGDLVYDPFVGTGSILVAAAHFGAHTMGADIDIRVVRDGEPLNCRKKEKKRKVHAVRRHNGSLCTQKQPVGAAELYSDITQAHHDCAGVALQCGV